MGSTAAIAIVGRLRSALALRSRAAGILRRHGLGLRGLARSRVRAGAGARRGAIGCFTAATSPASTSTSTLLARRSLTVGGHAVAALATAALVAAGVLATIIIGEVVVTAVVAGRHLGAFVLFGPAQGRRVWRRVVAIVHRRRPA
ncbi:MAG: hypothetical protein IPN32_06045 [Deltaproteobacteria bacterium]|nr:hypothetical protein [Deltaproteobacteria bacterium]